MDEYERRAERDRALVRGVCAAVTNIRHVLDEWIQEELKDQLIIAQMVQESMTGIIQTNAKEHARDINELSLHRLPEAITVQKSRVAQVTHDLDSDPFDNYMYLEESIFRLERMARMIYRLRKPLDGLVEDDPEKSDPELSDDVEWS